MAGVAGLTPREQLSVALRVFHNPYATLDESVSLYWYLFMKAAEKNLLPTIPIDLAIVVGEIVIRFGELERALITALARVTFEKEEEFIKEVGKHKVGDPLGPLVDRAKKEFEGKYDWFNASNLKNLKDRRNSIHDALMQELDGSYIWQSNSPQRPHRKVDYYELRSLRDDVIKTIIQINNGSLKAKKERIEQSNLAEAHKRMRRFEG